MLFYSGKGSFFVVLHVSTEGSAKSSSTDMCFCWGCAVFQDTASRADCLLCRRVVGGRGLFRNQPMQVNRAMEIADARMDLVRQSAQAIAWGVVRQPSLDNPYPHISQRGETTLGPPQMVSFLSVSLWQLNQKVQPHRCLLVVGG